LEVVYVAGCRAGREPWDNMDYHHRHVVYSSQGRYSRPDRLQQRPQTDCIFTLRTHLRLITVTYHR